MHWLAAGHRRLRHSHYRIRRAHVHIGLVVNRLVNVNRLIYIRDVHVVHDARVVHIHIAEVMLAAMIRRRVQLAETQRHPRQRRTHRHSHAHMWTTDPGNERGRIVRVHGRRVLSDYNRAWTPSPAAAHKHPAPIVKRSKPPIGLIHPGPTPRRNPNPVSKTVRRPVSRDCAGIPDGPILGCLFPSAVVIQVFVTDERGRHITQRGQMRLMVIALMTPAVKIVFTRRLCDIEGRIICAAQQNAVTGVNGGCLPKCVHLRRARPHHQETHLRYRIHSQTVVPIAQ